MGRHVERKACHQEDTFGLWSFHPRLTICILHGCKTRKKDGILAIDMPSRVTDLIRQHGHAGTAYKPAWKVVGFTDRSEARLTKKCGDIEWKDRIAE